MQHRPKRKIARGFAAKSRIARGFAAAAMGTVAATSCSPTELELFRQGLDVIIQAAQDEEEEISFADWLAQELRD